MASPMDAFALYCSCVTALIGLTLMLRCSSVWRSVLKEEPTPNVHRALTHYVFMYGLLAFAMGATNLGLSVGMPPVLAVLPGINSVVSVLVWMALNHKSITGIENVYGPPVLIRITFFLIDVLVHVSVIWHAVLEGQFSQKWIKFIGLYAGSLLIPHALAMCVRSRKISAAAAGRFVDDGSTTEANDI